MKAIALTAPRPLDHPEVFVELDLPSPVPGPRDLLVRVKAVSVNPVDYKVRRARQEAETAPKILGWDAAGTVEAVGEDVSRFRVGDEVYYAGDITRPGSNAELQLVDERIVARKPTTLDFPSSAALPLTGITAWEALFDRLGLKAGNLAGDKDRALLILNGAGGVGSIAIQLATALTGWTVIATASRPESAAWVRKMGAHHVIDHSGDWVKELETLGFATVEAIACFADTATHWEAMAKAIAPQGRICSIVESATVPDIGLLKSKSVTFVWEFMFTRSMFQTADMIAQHELLSELAQLIDAGRIRSTLKEAPGVLTPATLAEAHRQLEAGSSIGKIVLTLPE